MGHLRIHLKTFTLLIFLQSWTVLSGAGQDSLSYVFRQDNLLSSSDLITRFDQSSSRIHFSFDDLLRYKEFQSRTTLSQGRQYTVEHQLKTDISWGPGQSRSMRLESNQYEDHRTGLASNISNHALLGGFRAGEQAGAYLGFRSVERFGLVDRGWAMELDLDNSWQMGQNRLGLKYTGDRDDLDQHLSHSSLGNLDYSVRFGKIANFRSRMAYDQRLTTFYTDSLGSSQTRQHENFRWQTQFDYDLTNELEFYHQLTWSDQLTQIGQKKVLEEETLDIDGEDRNRFALINESGLKLVRPRFQSLTTFRTENAQNKYYVDYTQKLYQLSEDMNWQPQFMVDSLQWHTVLSRLEYDTPDTTNNDDRDEWRLNTELVMSWQPSPFYQVRAGTKLSLFHLIYLFSARSSENHWNRNLLLWTSFDWRRGSWSGESRGRIRSNYFDYDYDDIFLEMEQPTRSFVHRSLDLQQRLERRLSRNWSIHLKGSARWEDEGQLDWNAFVQQVRSDREQTEWVLKLFYDFRGWKGWIGYLEHDRLTQYASGTRDAERWQGQGPLFGLQYHLGRRLSVDADARFISVVDQDREYLLPKVLVRVVYR